LSSNVHHSGASGTVIEVEYEAPAILNQTKNLQIFQQRASFEAKEATYFFTVS
jgi:hypothetical protein